MAKGYKGKIPSSKNGSVPHWVDKTDKFDWHENRIFRTTMKIVGIHRGRSAANFIVKDLVGGQKYHMFMRDFWDLIENFSISNGVFYGDFTFVKRGKNYGVAPFTEKQGDTADPR